MAMRGGWSAAGAGVGAGAARSHPWASRATTNDASSEAFAGRWSISVKAARLSAGGISRARRGLLCPPTAAMARMLLTTLTLLTEAYGHGLPPLKRNAQIGGKVRGEVGGWRRGGGGADNV